MHSTNRCIITWTTIFFFGTGFSADCHRTYSAFLNICRACNIPVSQQKCCAPSTRMQLLGCIIDTEAMTISLPTRKVEDIVCHLRQLLRVRTARQRDVLSIAGKLVHAAKCIPAGRSFFRRLLDTAHSVTRPHYWVTMTADTRRDIQWWLAVLPDWNGTAPLINPYWTPPADTFLYTDASLIGYGGVHGTEWFCAAWPQATKAWTNSMSWMEMIPVLTACMLWGHSWTGSRITMYCDNEGVVGAWTKGWSKEPRLMSLIRQTMYVAAKSGFEVRCVHLGTRSNTVADSLSRLQIHKFKALHPAANAHSAAVPTSLQTFLSSPTEDCTVASGCMI